MKVTTLILCGLAVAAAYNQRWENFKKTYGKSYTTIEDENYRKSIYEVNQEIIDEHNGLFQQGLVSFDLAMNQFGDMTQEEVDFKMTGYVQVEAPSGQLHERNSLVPKAAAVDWREKGAVTPVKDQGSCGSCWSFSATGSMESAHFLKYEELISLSEQNLLDCTWDLGNKGCGGGMSYRAFRYVIANDGIDTEAAYPYLAKDGPCNFDPDYVGVTLGGYKLIIKGSESDLQDAVQNAGPVSVAIDATHKNFTFYSSGVYHERPCSTSHLNHAVLVVGYGDLDGDEYWIVKNSWGDSWGDEGYIKMARNEDNMCGIATQGCYPQV